MKRTLALGILVMLLLSPPASACSICGFKLDMRTLREDALQSRIVLYGTLANARTGNEFGVGGTTDLLIEKIVKSDPFLDDRKTIVLPRYVPVDPKNPPKFLVFCEIFKDKNKEQLDPYRGVPTHSRDVVGYLQESLAIDPKDRDKALLYFFDHLEHRDADVANDAFLELAKASDQDLVRVGAKFSAGKLRGWIQNDQTPVNRLSLYGFFLGLCGGDKDAALLESLLHDGGERTLQALEGILCGYIHLRPREGWEMVRSLLKDPKNPFTQRFAVLRTLRFYQGYKPAEQRRDIVSSLAIAIEQGDISDLAIEDLRRWQIWDLTPQVLAQYGKKSHSAPIVRHGILRYALTCPRPEAGRFVAERRGVEADLVTEVEESMQYEKTK